MSVFKGKSQQIPIQEFFERILDERDKRTSAAFLASEKAIGKAEEAQKAYNVVHNDLSRRMEALIQLFMQRPDVLALLTPIEKDIKSLQDDIRILREWKSNVEGKFTVVVAVSNVVTLLVSVGVAIVLHFIK